MLPSLPALPTFCHYCRTESLAPQCITFLTLGILTPSPKATVQITSLIIDSDFVNIFYYEVLVMTWKASMKSTYKSGGKHLSFIHKCIFSQLSHKCTIKFSQDSYTPVKKRYNCQTKQILVDNMKMKTKKRCYCKRQNPILKASA